MTVQNEFWKRVWPSRRDPRVQSSGAETSLQMKGKKHWLACNEGLTGRVQRLWEDTKLLSKNAWHQKYSDEELAYILYLYAPRPQHTYNVEHPVWISPQDQQFGRANCCVLKSKACLKVSREDKNWPLLILRHCCQCVGTGVFLEVTVQTAL